MEEFTEDERNNATTLKMCLMGDAGVGKSNIANQFAVNAFTEAYVATIGVEFQTKLLRCTQNRNNIRKLQIWDTAGQERFRSITTSYVRGSIVLILVYDVTERSSFESIENHWINQSKQQAGPNTAVFIVGNKIDLGKQRQVKSEEGEALAAKHQCHFMEISAKEGQEGVIKLFQWVVDLLELPVEERKKILMLETEDTVWTNRMIGLLKNPELFRNYSGLQIYEPIVKLIAPGLLRQEVIDWIAWNHDFLTPDVLQRLVTMAHFFSFEKKGATYDNLVHLYLVSHACKFDLLGDKVVEYFGSKRDGAAEIEAVVKNSPKLIPNNSVVDLNQAANSLIERVYEFEPKERKHCAELWRDMIGQLYAERDTTGDFTVIVNTRHYKAHKVILAFATPFFELPNHTEVRLEKDISNSAWEQLLKYFYTRDFKAITDPMECLEILSIGSYLTLSDPNNAPTLPSRDHTLLMQHCHNLVFSSITDDTALDRLVAAVNRGDLVDKSITMRYWVTNYERLFAKYENQLAALPKSIMFSLMSRVIQHETATKGKI